jgi:predicted GH43/DUF377 family glycosyl hydrolase
MNGVEETAKEIGRGRTVVTKSGITIFQLASHPANPIVTPQDLGLVWEENGKKRTGAVFNGGAVKHADRIWLAPRCHHHYYQSKFFDPKLGRERVCLENYVSEVRILTSRDGKRFQYTGVTIYGDGREHQDFKHGIEDIRIVRCEDFFVLVGCGKTGPPFKASGADRIAVYTTRDFQDIEYRGIVDVFDSRNAIPLFTAERDYIFLRFHPNIHVEVLTEGRDQILEPKKYRDKWIEIYKRKEQSVLFRAGELDHEKEKIGPSTPLIETEIGWLFLYHGVGRIASDIARAYGLESGIERGYSVCAAILDRDDPRKVLYRCRWPIYIPNRPWELYGDARYPVDVPAVVFPVGALTVDKKLLIYAGSGDKYEIVLGCELGALVDYLEEYGRSV